MPTSAPVSATPLVLVGMSPHEPAHAALLAALAAPYDARVAHLQVGDPSLRRVLDDVALAGATRVRLVGVRLGRLAPGHSWLRRVAAHWWRDHPAPPVVEVAAALVGDDDELRSVATAGPELVREVTGDEAGLASAAWEDVPGHRHQVLVCRGPRCTARGAEDTAVALTVELVRLGLGDDDVLLTHTACLFPCNHAPVVSVQPDDVWYSRVDPTGVRRIASEHLAGDRPVADLRLARTRRDAR